MFNRTCKVCLERDRLITHLQEEVKTLRSALFPSAPVLTPELVEADAVLSGHQGEPEPTYSSDEERKQAEAELYERDALLAGNY